MRASRTILWGSIKIKRSAVPELLSDLSLWPTADPTGMCKKDRKGYDSNCEAIRLFVEERHVSIAQIAKKTGVHREQLYRLLNRCLQRDDDGRIYGFRGAIPRKRVTRYTRRAAVNAVKPKGLGGAAGAFGALLEKFPDIESWLKRQSKLRKKPLGEEVREVKQTVRRLHKKFLEKCKAAGVRDTEYPFNRDYLGFRTFQKFVKHEGLGSGSSDGDGDDSVDSPGIETSGNGYPKGVSGIPAPILPFDAVQFDGHKIDLRITLKLIDPFGLEVLFELTRIFILVCLDVVTRAALGYQIVLATEYDSDEVGCALQSCFGPFKAPRLTIPGLSIRSGGGFPSEIFEEAKYPGWRWFQFDSARANIAEANLDRLFDVVGCYIHTGRLGEPDDRSFIERFFAQLARFGFHQVPGSTGSSPTDEVRTLADVGSDISRLMTVDELEQVVYAMLGDYNGESHAGLGGRTPLEAMRYWLNKPNVRIRSLPAQKRQHLIFLQEARIATVVAGSREHPRPHINFEGVRYSSDQLAPKPELVGKRLRIYFNIRDIRHLRAYFEDGAELGVLNAARSWRKTPHSLRLRREILRLTRLGKLRYRDGEDAIEAWAIYKRCTASKDKRSANALAKQKQVQDFAEDSETMTTEQSGRNQPEKNLAADKSAAVGEGVLRQDRTGDARTETEQAEPPKAKPLAVRRTIVFGGGR